MSATNVAREGKRGHICVGDNVSFFARAFKLPVKAFASTTAAQVTTPESKNVIGQMKQNKRAARAARFLK